MYLAESVKTLIGEFKTLSPDIADAVVFKSDGEALAATEGTTPEEIQTLIAQLNSITHAGCIGGLEGLIIQDVNTQFSVRSIKDVYLATVSSRAVNQKVIESLTKVVAPMVIRLAFSSDIPTVTEIQPLISKEAAYAKAAISSPEEELETNVLPQPQTPPEPSMPKPPVTQFMVEKIGGIFVPTDTVHIDSEVIGKWQDLYDGKQFTLVSIETLEGKTVRCKYKPQKDAKTNAKGIIQIPEKLLQTLNSGKGKLVMVKPVID